MHIENSKKIYDGLMLKIEPTQFHLVNLINWNNFIWIIGLLVVTYNIFVRFMGKINPSYHCPRCKTTKILEYEDFIECPNCFLEFDKELFGKIPDDNMLSRQELRGMFDAFPELKNPENAKKIFDSILEDLNDEN